MEIINIPRSRVKAVLGDANSTIEMLRERMKVSINADRDGAVEMHGEPVDEFFAKEVMRGIGRGFEPRIALKLLNDQYAMNVIDLRDYGHNPDAVARIKGRVIGEKGKAKRIIEEEGECDLAIHGHTVAVLAPLEVLDVATTAIFKLLEGQPHSSVYLYLERLKRKRKQDEIVELRSGKMAKK